MEGILFLVLSVSVLLVVLFKLKSLFVAEPNNKLPPRPWMLPVIGNLHNLITGPNIHRAMRRLSQKHGPLMALRLGKVPAIVVTSPEAMQEVMKTHDVAFADRYVNATFGALTFDGNDVAFAPYGERWRQLRKICTVELLSAARVLSFRRIREEEVARFMENLAAASAGTGTAVNLSNMISRFINDTFVRESVGSRCKYQDEYLNALQTAMRQTSGLPVADLFPSSRLMQVLDTAPRKVLACRNTIQGILEEIIEETKEAMEDHGDDQVEAGTGSEGFVGVLLRLQKECSTPIPLDDDTIVAVMFDIFAGGSETWSVLNWCMTELVRNPEAMAKVQAELREAFKGKNTIDEDDLKGLHYLKLVIKEALRLHTPAPLLVPRKCREACKVLGYDVPKGTVVFINMWGICRDPKYWDDPEEFKPEWFENSNLDYKGTNYEFLPFGAGRRSCPGTNLALGNIELALASLLYHFDLKLPQGIEAEDVDISEAAGFVASKKTSLIVHAITRIPPAPANV